MNAPEVKLGLVSVSRDCFPVTLSVRRRAAVAQSYRMRYGQLCECTVCVESEKDVPAALDELRESGCNALCVLLGNFGPEVATSRLLQQFDGVSMVVASAEETQEDLVQGRGDALCGLLSLRYNLNLRKTRVWIPEAPVGSADECADAMSQFVPIARAVFGVRHLKIISFGPRPRDFVACNAPIAPLFSLHTEIEENSELDLLEAFLKHSGDTRISEIVWQMERELGQGNTMPQILPKLAQYELTLTDWVCEHTLNGEFVAFADKCWPAFQTQFGFVPCYVNARLAARGVPVACEADIYGALSEYIAAALTGEPATILDINNTVPADMYRESIQGRFAYRERELFMGFHCGNTAPAKLRSCRMCNQLIMARTLDAAVTRGTVEGDLLAGEITMFRLHAAPDGGLQAYAAQGEILPVATRSFGTCGVIAVRDFDRFYRYGLLENAFPHHCCVAFAHCGKALCSVWELLGVDSKAVVTPPAPGCRYPGERF